MCCYVCFWGVLLAIAFCSLQVYDSGILSFDGLWVEGKLVHESFSVGCEHEERQ